MPTRFLLLTWLLVAAWSTAAGAQPAPRDAAPVDPEPRLSFQFGTNMRFGLVVLKDAAGKAINKRLIYAADGGTNSTVVRIDGKDLEFGGPAGKWLEKASTFPNGSKSVWAAAGVQVTQSLEILPSQQPVEVAPGVRKRLLDTCLISYAIVNDDHQDHTVGLRIQVDTLIGGNDGVPFTVPTLTGLVNTFKDFTSPKEVPEFIQALEVPDLLKPGTVGHMTIKVGGSRVGGLEPPSRVSLTHWPGSNFTKWEVPVVNMGSDSAVVIYWNADHRLKPKERRNLGFAYGLGKVSSSEGTGKLALTVNGSFLARESFTVTAYVQDPAKGQTLTLEVPAGLERVAGKTTEPVPPPSAGSGKTSVITWKVKAPQPGTFVLKARSSTGVSQSQPVTIRAGSGTLAALAVSGLLGVNQVFTVTATVRNPSSDQNLTLTLPEGLERMDGNDRQAVPLPLAPAEESTVAWKVKADKAGAFTVNVRSNTNENLSKSITITGPKTDLELLDARRALQMSVGNLAEDFSLDLDADGRVTSLDAALILQRVADQTRKGK